MPYDTSPPFKKCPSCKTDKTLEEFARRPNRRTRFGSHCLKCAQAYKKAHRVNTKARKFGLTRPQLEAIFGQQEQRCGICRLYFPALVGTEKARRDSAHVDHDHRTGEVRGLLCSNCNFGLGFFKDDPSLLVKAIGYLREPIAPQVLS